MRIKELIHKTGLRKNISLKRDFVVKGISCNSKTVKHDYCFVAIKGICQDGDKFINDAFKRGAGIIFSESAKGKAGLPLVRIKDARLFLGKLASEFYGNPTSSLKVVGVTGTNGKTTVTYLLEEILKESSLNPAVIGTINYRFKDKVFPSKNTTPGPIELQSMFADMLKSGVDYCVAEVSSHALDQHRIKGVNFHSAIFTNLTQDHLDYHKSLDNYFNAKARLFKGLSSKALAVINHDDKMAPKLKKLCRAKLITYGINKKSDVMAKEIVFNCDSTRFKLISKAGEAEIKTRLIGRHNVYNILAVFAWAISAGISLRNIKSAIEHFSLVPGRLEKVDSDSPFSVFVDYAHTEDALANVLSALREIAQHKIIIVFGCGGDRDKTKRPKMGRIVSELSDYAIITNDNPRSEDPLKIIRQIENGFVKKNYCIIPNRQEAIKKSLSLADKGDIVLLAGKGHEEYQIIKDKVLHFSDREIVRKCLNLAN